MAFKDKLKTIIPATIGVALTGSLLPVLTVFTGLAWMDFIPVAALAGTIALIYKFNKIQRDTAARPLGGYSQSDLEQNYKSNAFKRTIKVLFLGAAFGVVPGMVASVRIDQNNKTPEQKRQDQIERIEHACKPYDCVKNNDGSYTIPAPK